MEWKDSFISTKDFELVLGKSLLDDVKINLEELPHILVAGSTGSGKSVLLRLLLYQALKKGADVHIADFKGGVDFGTWEKVCNLITEFDELKSLLYELVEELSQRKKMLRASGTKKLSEYNKTAAHPLKRIIFAVDELAELIDKSGASTERKKQISEIEGMLSLLAQQGRSFGVHLFLSTQRPDAQIVTGQIKNNIIYRVCGRADNNLSIIVLDSAIAAEEIPQYEQGLFVDSFGTVFRAYYSDFSSLGKEV